MSNFKKGQKVVKVIQTPAFANFPSVKTASIQKVESVKKGVVRLSDSCISYSESTGYEIEPAVPGCVSQIIVLEQ